MDSGYRGCQTSTRSGRTCEKWDSQHPHSHEMKPGTCEYCGLDNNNYCRNPHGTHRTIWCYTMDPNVRWEYCDPKDIDDAEMSTSFPDVYHSTTDSDWSDEDDGDVMMTTNPHSPHTKTTTPNFNPALQARHSASGHPGHHHGMWTHTTSNPRANENKVIVGGLIAAGSSVVVGGAAGVIAGVLAAKHADPAHAAKLPWDWMGRKEPDTAKDASFKAVASGTEAVPSGTEAVASGSEAVASSAAAAAARESMEQVPYTTTEVAKAQQSSWSAPASSVLPFHSAVILYVCLVVLGLACCAVCACFIPWKQCMGSKKRGRGRSERAISAERLSRLPQEEQEELEAQPGTETTINPLDESATSLDTTQDQQDFAPLMPQQLPFAPYNAGGAGAPMMMGQQNQQDFAPLMTPMPQQGFTPQYNGADMPMMMGPQHYVPPNPYDAQFMQLPPHVDQHLASLSMHG